MTESAEAFARSHAVGVVRERVWALTVWTAIALWATALFAILRDHYIHFRIGRYDLGNMVQAIWSTTQGRPLEVTEGVTGEQVIRLAYHVDPILTLLAPLWIAFPSPLLPIAVQAAAVALGALPIFWLARRHLGSERAAAFLALAYLAYPWTAWAVLDVFHPLSLAIPLLLYAVWFLDGDRVIPFAVFAVLAAGTGELVGITIAALGAWYALARGRRRAGWAIAAAGGTWSALALFVVVPAFSGGSSVFYGAFDDVGGSPTGVLRTAVTDPGTILAAVTRAPDIAYVALVSAPLVAAFALAPGLAAVGLPQLVANLLASFGATTDPRAHYLAPVLPFLFAATAVGLGRLAPRGREPGALVVLTACAAATIMLGPWSTFSIGKPAWWEANPSADAVALRNAAVSLVPAGAPVSATNTLGAHLADRRYIVSAPTLGEARWVVVDANDTWRPLAWGGTEDPAALRQFLRDLRSSPSWQVVLARDGVFVFRRQE